MMRNEMVGRLKTAAGYQRQAILALLPEGMEGHLDVIEKEIKSMVAETMTKVMEERVRSSCKSDEPQDGTDSKVKKVTIE